MRILHINCNYLGTTLHQLMVEQLDKMGYVNQVYVPTYDKSRTVISPNKNVIVSECFNKWDRVVFDYKQQKIFRDVQSQVDVASHDCIHAYTLFTDGNCARKLSKKYGIPYVVAVRNTDVNDFFAKMLHLRDRGIDIMRDAKAIFFLSEAYRQEVFNKYVPHKYRESLFRKTYIIPNGIDAFWIHNCSKVYRKVDTTEEIKLVYAGRIDRNKNILMTQKAMKLLQEAGYHVSLTVVGKIQDKREYNRIVLDRCTTCLPAMPKEKLIDVYRSSDIFVMPSITESFGLVYAEAMSQGLPVVYTQGQGFDGQFPEGTVGFHVLSGDARSVADGIRKVIERYTEISGNVAECAKKFQWASIAQEYDTIYRTVCK